MPKTFAEILDSPSGETKRPPVMPQGTYLMVTKGLPRFDVSSQKKTEFYEYTCGLISAMKDVDEDALAEIGGCAGKEMTYTFYLTERAAYRLKEFLVDTLLIDDDGGDKTIRQMVDESVGIQFLGTVTHTPTNDGKGVYANIGRTAPAED